LTYDLTVAWRKSTRSDNTNNCVEVVAIQLDARGVVAARDSTNPTGPALTLTPAAWIAFASAIKTGAFDG
jgi:hypothetical protein